MNLVVVGGLVVLLEAIGADGKRSSGNGKELGGV